MTDPFELPPDVLGKIPLFAEIAKVLSWHDGPVNWDLARQVASSIAVDGAPASISEVEQTEIVEHVRIAELWVEELAGLPTTRSVLAARAASPNEWAEHAAVAFAELIDPIAAKAARALGSNAESGGVENLMAQAMGQIAPMFMGVQAGTVLGGVAREVTGTHETGLPVGEDSLLLVLPAIDAIAAEYGLDRRQVRQWIAVRAVAVRAITEGFPSARANFFAFYHDFVASLDVDLAEGIARLQSLDLTDPSRLQEVLGDEGLLNPQPSAATAVAGERLVRFLALVGAHADAAVETAADRVGDGGRVAEVFARRALESKGVAALYGFIGLEPPEPAIRRAAVAFVRAIIDARGIAAVTRMWDDSESFPTSEELGTPHIWLERTNA